MEACLEKTEDMDLEANPEEIEPEMEHQRSLMKRLQWRLSDTGGLASTVGCRQPKKQTQGNSGSRKKLATTCRQMTCCVIPTQRKGHGRQRPGMDKFVHGTPKRRTFVKGHHGESRGNNCMRDQGAR
jgi:hypothetical protein